MIAHGGSDIDGSVFQHDHVEDTVDGVQVHMRLGKRDEQQDAAYVGPRTIAVADGMGGHARGAEASRVALETFERALTEGAALEVAVGRADVAVRALSDGPALDAPGTTLVAARLEGASIRGVWSGDSRAYRLRSDGGFEPLTADHVDLMGGIEHALGAFDPDPVHVDTFEVDPADTAGLLLCSDGLTGPFDAAQRRGGPPGALSLVEDDPVVTMGALLVERGLSGLVDVAARAGSDNLTALWWPLRDDGTG